MPWCSSYRTQSGRDAANLIHHLPERQATTEAVRSSVASRHVTCREFSFPGPLSAASAELPDKLDACLLPQSYASEMKCPHFPVWKAIWNHIYILYICEHMCIDVEREKRTYILYVCIMRIFNTSGSCPQRYDV